MNEIFRTISTRTARAIGSIWAFVTLIVLLGVTGYYSGLSERWKIEIAWIAGVTGLALLFLLQASQNHNDRATHIKLDELINAIEGARDEIVSVEEQSEREMKELKKSNPAEANSQ
jgi:low affinity Fe/Cu permease